jgi:hypothetical protein
MSGILVAIKVMFLARVVRKRGEQGVIDYYVVTMIPSCSHI